MIYILLQSVELNSALMLLGLHKYVGQVTAPFESDKPATHALVIILRGIAVPWKQTVSYYFTGDFTAGHILWQVVCETIKKAHSIGLCVRACISDMGAGNQDMWRHIGITSSRENLKNCIPHPCNDNNKLYFLADPPHLLKNIRNCLLSQTITLPDDVVKNANLPSNIVSLEHVKFIVTAQQDMELKIAPKLKSIHLKPGQFQKMKVNLAAQLLSHSTATAINFAVQRQLLPVTATTTAWFLQAVNDWFDILNARFALCSLFRSSATKIAHLEFIMNMFANLHFGGRDGWKPIQAGVRLSTQSVLCLYQELVVSGSYRYLLTGRLTQDCVENLFSQIRSKGDSHPSPVHFRHNIRLISMSQYMRTSSSSSYDEDNSTYFLDFMKRRSKDKSVIEDERFDLEMAQCSALLPLSAFESNALYTLAGWAVFKEKTSKSCPACVASITGNAKNAPSYSELTILKSFKSGNGLTHPSQAALQAIIAAESIFVANQDRLTKMDEVLAFLMRCFRSQISAAGFPTCHDILHSVVERFFRLRLHVHGARVTRNFSTVSAAIQHGSRSAHCRTKIK